jgi:hypothetical protein
MKTNYKLLIFMCAGISLLGFFLGWLFPVEGPVDYLYDNYASRPAIKRPSKCCAAPLPAPKKTEIFEDLNEDGEPEWYEVVPLFNILEE